MHRHIRAGSVAFAMGLSQMLVHTPPPSRDAAGSARNARLALGLFAVVALFFVAITFSPLGSGFADAPPRGPGDVALYRAEINRIHGGQHYYEAAAGELKRRGYPTASVFNWRTPLPVWLVAALPSITAANALLGALGFALLCVSFELAAVEAGVKQAMLGVVLLIGALLPCVLGDLVVMSELWSGVLVALSAVCFGIKKPEAGVLVGVAALFFRELAAPYCLVCVALAAHDRRYHELKLWAAGLAAYGLFFAFHVWHVLPRAGQAEIANIDGWIHFGGAGFLISTAQVNAYLLLLPQWVTALYLAAALLCAAEWNSPAGVRIGLSIAVYAMAFSIAGNDFNQYWGSMTAPLYALAVCRLPGTISRLWDAARYGPPTARAHLSLAR